MNCIERTLFRLLFAGRSVLGLSLIAMLFTAQAQAFCGIQPMPRLGCYIGECVNGQWEQICQSNYGGHATSLQCGIKPMPQLGCVIGDCVNGQWEQVCGFRGNAEGNLTCGFKPFPSLGCVIGDCVNGQWQQICN